MADLGRNAHGETSELNVGSGNPIQSNKGSPTPKDIAASVGSVHPDFQFPQVTDAVRAKCERLLS